MRINDYENRNFIAITAGEAVIVAGGKDEAFAELVNLFGRGLGIISKLGWKLMKACQQCIAEQGREGNMMMHK